MLLAGMAVTASCVSVPLTLIAFFPVYAVSRCRAYYRKSMIPLESELLSREFLEQIRELNGQKPDDAPLALVLQTNHDPRKAFQTSGTEFDLLHVAKTHLISIRIVGREPFPSILEQARDGIKTPRIVWFQGHGDENSIQFAKGVSYTTDRVRASDFEAIDPKGTILLDACFTGRSLAKRIAAVQTRTVQAPLSELIFTCYPFCDLHGIEMVGYNEQGRQIVQKHQGASSCDPCCNPEKLIAEKIAHIERQHLRGVHLAAYDLGVVHEIGVGVPRDLIKSANYYEAGMRQGDPVSTFKLGFICAELNNYQKAFDCFEKIKDAEIPKVRRAARLNLGEMAYRLGTLHRSGKIQNASLDAATRYFRLAEKYGDEALRQQARTQLAWQPPVFKAPEWACLLEN